MKEDIEYLKAILEPLVSEPQKIKIERKVDEMGVLLEVKLAKEDMGQIIGKKGQNIQAIRQLLKMLGAKNKAMINIKLME